MGPVSRSEAEFSSPRISIAIPTKNRPDLLVEAIESVRAQTYANWEVIVVDDHSEDDSVASVRARYADDARIRVLIRDGERGGAPVCRNQAFQASTGAYIIFLDSDDLLAPFCLEHRIQTMEEDSSLDFATFPSELFATHPGDQGVLWNTFGGDSDLTRFLRWDGPWQTTGPIWRRAVIDRLGGWDETVPSWQDFEWHIRALLLNLRYAAIDRRDNFIRRNPEATDNINLQDAAPARLEARAVLYQRLTAHFREAGALTEENRGLLIGGFLQMARMRIWSSGDRAHAVAIWRRCQDAGLIDAAEESIGRFALRALESRPWAWDRLGRFLEAKWHGYAHSRWPTACEVGESPTARVTAARYDDRGFPIAPPAGGDAAWRSLEVQASRLQEPVA